MALISINVKEEEGKDLSSWVRSLIDLHVIEINNMDLPYLTMGVDLMSKSNDLHIHNTQVREFINEQISEIEKNIKHQFIDVLLVEDFVVKNDSYIGFMNEKKIYYHGLYENYCYSLLIEHKEYNPRVYKNLISAFKEKTKKGYTIKDEIVLNFTKLGLFEKNYLYPFILYKCL